jgi:hypothetical protein
LRKKHPVFHTNGPPGFVVEYDDHHTRPWLREKFPPRVKGKICELTEKSLWLREKSVWLREFSLELRDELREKIRVKGKNFELREQFSS